MRGERDSSIELYRILATLSVLIAHWNGWFVGGFLDASVFFQEFSSFRCGQLIIGACCACCINCFLLISGYFSIRLRTVSIIRYIILLQGIFVPFYLLYCVIGEGSFSFYSLIGSAFSVTKGGYFIQDYFILMLLSPILNSFIDKNGKRSLGLCIVLVLVELYFDCIMKVEEMGIKQGYSVFHFCLMYLIGRIIFLYKDELKNKPRYYYLLGYFICVIFIILLYLVHADFAFNYSNPIVILAGVFSFVPFIFKKRKNKVINWLANGSFAVYVIQLLEPAHSFLLYSDNHLLANQHYAIYILLSSLFVIAFYLVCIVYDKARNYISEPFVILISEKIDIAIEKVRLRINT